MWVKGDLLEAVQHLLSEKAPGRIAEDAGTFFTALNVPPTHCAQWHTNFLAAEAGPCCRDDRSVWWLGQHAVLGGWTLTARALGGCEGSWDSPGSAAPCLQLGCRGAIKAAGSSCSEPAAVPLLMGESAKREGFVATWSQAAPHSPARPRALLGMFLCSSLVCSSCQA